MNPWKVNQKPFLLERGLCAWHAGSFYQPSYPPKTISFQRVQNFLTSKICSKFGMRDGEMKGRLMCVHPLATFAERIADPFDLYKKHQILHISKLDDTYLSRFSRPFSITFMLRGCCFLFIFSYHELTALPTFT